TVENRTHSKTNGLFGPDGTGTLPLDQDKEFQHENRTTFQVAYSPTMRLTVSGSIPYMDRRHVYYESGSVRRYLVENVGDAEFQARYDALVAHVPGRYAAATVIGGIVAPTGPNDVRVDGELLPEHNQPGTGAWAYEGGLAGQFQTSAGWAYASAIVKQVTT